LLEFQKNASMSSRLWSSEPRVAQFVRPEKSGASIQLLPLGE